MVDVIIVALILVQMGVVVGRRAGMGTYDTLVFPGIGIRRIVVDHIAHSALVGFRNSDVLLLLVFVPVGILTICPIGAIGINELTIEEVQFAGLEVIGSGNLDGTAVEFDHRGLQFDDTGIIRLDIGAFLVGVATAEGEPARAVLVDHHTGVEDPVTGQRTWGVAIDQRRLEG